MKEPHDEDKWSSISIGGNGRKPDPSVDREINCSAIELEVIGPCPRCSMVNVDGSSGSFDCRAFEALAEYRKMGCEVHFGQFLKILDSNDWNESDSIIVGVVEVGIDVKVFRST